MITLNELTLIGVCLLSYEKEPEGAPGSVTQKSHRCYPHTTYTLCTGYPHTPSLRIGYPRSQGQEPLYCPPRLVDVLTALKPSCSIKANRSIGVSLMPVSPFVKAPLTVQKHQNTLPTMGNHLFPKAMRVRE